MKLEDLDHISLSNLQHNIQTLQRINPGLAGRIALPVLDDHVRLQDGKILLTQARTEYWLNPPYHDWLPAEKTIDGCVFLFGAGNPAFVKHLLERASLSQLIVWDRDPLLLRLLLMQADFSEEIANGRLQLALGIDLMDYVGEERYSRLSHPVLQQLYYAEYDLWSKGLRDKRVMITPESLYSFEAFRFFNRKGFSVYTLDLKRISLDEIQYALLKFQPELLFVINYISGLAELAHQLKIPVACWEIDPFTEHLKRPTAPTDWCYVYCYRHALVKEFKQVGFKHVSYLPMGVDTELRKPVKLKPSERKKYSAPLAFVGSSMVESALNYRRMLFEYYDQFQKAQNTRQQFEANLEEILQIQRDNFESYVIQELAAHYFHDFIQFAHEQNWPDPVKLIAEIAASEKRLNYLRLVTRFGLKLWGDRGWKVLESCGARYMGPAGRHQEINKIYAATRINLDINRLYQADIVPIRIFDVLACGGFLLAEYSEELENLFDLERELVCYQTEQELVSKIQFFLQHPEEAQHFAEAGRKAVLEKHTFDLRMQKIMDQLPTSKSLKVSSLEIQP